MSENIKKTMGVRIAALRQTRGQTSEELSRFAGITPRKLTRIENGTGPLDVEQAHWIARGLGVRLSVLFGEERFDPRIDVVGAKP
jgi:transcriptional regulator with XRE-family HTH domain